MSNAAEIPGLEVINNIGGKRPSYHFEAPLQLTAWAGFNASHSFFDETSDGASEGRTRVEIGETVYDGEPELRPEMIAAYEYMLKQQDSIRDTILAALQAKYPEMRQQYDYSAEEAAELMPEVTDAAQFRDLIGLSWVHILDTSRDGQSYVGYEFGASWDEEHGLGVLTHKDRIVAIGDAETAFADWLAEEDAGGEA
ncbi:DUF6985 domain-containing protein [Flaviaesturariibacter terrae]